MAAVLPLQSPPEVHFASVATLSCSSFELCLFSGGFPLKRAESRRFGEVLMPSHLLSTSAASACSRFSTHGWIELIRLTLPRSSAPTGYTFSGGLLFTPPLPLCTFFLSDVPWHVLSRRERTSARLWRPGREAPGVEHVSLFIRPHWRRVLGSRSDNHNQQPTMSVFNSAAAGDPGHQGPLPILLELFPSVSHFLFPPPSISSIPFEHFIALNLPHFLFFFCHKIVDPSRRRPSARPRHQRD